MSNPGFFDNIGKNLGAISQTPRKLFEMANKSDNPVGNAVQGVGQNLGSIGNALNAVTGGAAGKAYNALNFATRTANPVQNAISVYGDLTGKKQNQIVPQTPQEKIRQNIRTEGDVRRLRDIVNYAPEITGKNLEQAIVYAPEFIAGAGGAVLGSRLGLPGAIGGAVGGQLGLGALADKNPWLKSGLDAWHTNAQNFANWTTGKQPTQKGGSVRSEEVDKLKLKSYQEQADRIRKLLKEGKITEQEAQSYLRDFHIGAGTLDFAGDMLLDPTNLIDFGGGKAGKVARKLDPNLGVKQFDFGQSNIIPEKVPGFDMNSYKMSDPNISQYSLNNNQVVSNTGDLPVQITPQNSSQFQTPFKSGKVSNTDPGVVDYNFGETKPDPRRIGDTVQKSSEVPKINETFFGQVQNSPESPTQISSIGDYIRDEVVPSKKSDLQAMLDAGTITPSAAKKRQATIDKYEAEAVSPNKINDFRPLGTSFAPETQKFIDDFSAKLKELNQFAPEQSIKVTGKEDVPFQNELQKTMINYGNFDRLRRPLNPQEQAYKNEVDKILATEYGMTPEDLKAFLDESGYVRANNRKSIDQNYSTKYNDNIGGEGYFASNMSPNKGVPSIQDGQSLVDANRQNTMIKNSNSPLTEYTKNIPAYGTHTTTGYTEKSIDESLFPNIAGSDNLQSKYQYVDSPDNNYLLNDRNEIVNRPNISSGEIILNSDNKKNPFFDSTVYQHENTHGSQNDTLSDMGGKLASDDIYTDAEKKRFLEEDFTARINQIANDEKQKKSLETFLDEAVKKSGYSKGEILDELEADIGSVEQNPELVKLFIQIPSDADIKNIIKSTPQITQQLSKYGSDIKEVLKRTYFQNLLKDSDFKWLLDSPEEFYDVYSTFNGKLPVLNTFINHLRNNGIDFSPAGSDWVNKIIKKTQDIKQGKLTNPLRPNLDLSEDPSIAGDLSRNLDKKTNNYVQDMQNKMSELN